MLKVRLGRMRGPPGSGAPRAAGAMLGEVEEDFARDADAAATPSSSPARCCASRASCETTTCLVAPAAGTDPKMPVLCGRQVPALDLPGRAGARHAGRPGATGGACRAACAEWLEAQRDKSMLPRRDETAGRDLPAREAALSGLLPVRGAAGAPDARHAADAPAGAGAAEAAGLRRRPTMRIGGLGAGDIGAALARALDARRALFDEDMLGDDLEAWLAEAALMKRTFRHCAIIAGLIERRFPGQEKTRPAGHLLDRPHLRRAAPARAGPHPAQGDARRCGDGAARPEAPRDMLARIKGRIVHKALEHVSPLAVSVMLEIGTRDRSTARRRRTSWRRPKRS